MTDSYTEVTRENIFSRTKNAIGSVVFGIVLFLVAFPVLWLNEGRAVKTAKALTEIGNSYTIVSPASVDAANNNKLIYVNGTATTDDVLRDTTFGISQPGISLSRDVEMYQWQEKESTKTEEKLGGTKETTKTYSYKKEWSSRPNDSADFKVPEGHSNPSMRYTQDNFTASNVKVGAFELNSALQNNIRANKKLTLTDADLSKISNELQANTLVNNGEFYVGDDPANPQIGDYRIRYTYAPKEVTVSILAKQNSDTFGPYTTSNGKSMMFLRTGTVGPDEIVGQEQASNTLLTWILRGLGMLAMFIGLTCIVAPLRVLSSVIPMLGSLVGATFGFISFLISLALSTVVIASAWIFYRPVLGISLLVVAGVLVFLGYKFGKKKAVTPSAAPASAPPPPAPSAAVPPPVPE